MASTPSIQTLPNATSTDYDAMYSYWRMVLTMIAGTQAMRDAAELYLPKFTNEQKADYEYRRKNAVFTNVYSDIVNNLAAKPFAEEMALDDSAADVFKTLAEDIDGRGNNLHVFGQETFYWGINNAVDWILVDYPKAKPGVTGNVLTIADERRQGLRPYWVHVTAPRMLAVYSDVVGSKEIITHARLSEIVRERKEFSEVAIERVRVFNREPIFDELTGRVVNYSPATFQLWEKRTTSGTSAYGRDSTQWIMVDEGPITIGVIPLVPFITGRRIESSWQFIPAMRDCAYAQVEHYQAETNLKSIKELTAFPMLTGNGVSPPSNKESQAVGPRVILYAPPYGDTGSSGSWQFIEPNGTSLTFLAGEIDRIEKQMRELGRQPLTAQSGNLTVVTTAFAAQKGNSAVQAWALNLKDAVEQAFVLTAMWLALSQADAPTVRVYTDFAVEMGDDKGPTWLTDMAKRGRLSRRTEWEEAQRRNILSSDFDPDEEDKRIADEEPPAPSPADIKAALTLAKPPPTTPTPKPANKAA